MIAILLMSCYWDSPHNQQGIRNRQSLIQLTIMFFSMSFNGLIAGCMCGTAGPRPRTGLNLIGFFKHPKQHKLTVFLYPF
jgi:hypothetical protein